MDCVSATLSLEHLRYAFQSSAALKTLAKHNHQQGLAPCSSVRSLFHIFLCFLLNRHIINIC